MSKKLSFKDLVELQETKDKFKEMLGDNGILFLESATQIVLKDPKLKEAEPESVLNSVSAIASLNLLIDPMFGQAFINVYKFKDGFKWRKLAQFIIGYKGLIELGLRTNKFETINSIEVREGEIIRVDRLTGEIEFDWIQDQDERNKKPIIGFVAFFKLTNGFRKSMYMTVKEMQGHGKKWSSTFKDKDGQWNKDFDGMGKKTVLKLLLDKYAPKSIEMQRAISFDQAIINDLNGDSLNYADNPNNQKKLSLDEHNRLIEKQRIIDHIKRSKTLEQLNQCFESIPDEETMDLFKSKQKEIKNKLKKDKQNEK